MPSAFLCKCLTTTNPLSSITNMDKMITTQSQGYYPLVTNAYTEAHILKILFLFHIWQRVLPFNFVANKHNGNTALQAFFYSCSIDVSCSNQLVSMTSFHFVHIFQCQVTSKFSLSMAQHHRKLHVSDLRIRATLTPKY